MQNPVVLATRRISRQWPDVCLGSLLDAPQHQRSRSEYAPADAPATAGAVQRLEKMVDMVEQRMETLREELARKNTQIEQLHVLLQQQAVALPAPRENRRSWWRLW